MAAPQKGVRSIDIEGKRVGCRVGVGLVSVSGRCWSGVGLGQSGVGLGQSGLGRGSLEVRGYGLGVACRV